MYKCFSFSRWHFSLKNSPLRLLKISFLVQMPPLGLKVYTILESASSDPHLAEYVLHNGNVKDKGIFNMKNVKSTEEDITLENSFIKLRFGQSGLMEVCSEKFSNSWRGYHFYYNMCSLRMQRWKSWCKHSGRKDGWAVCIWFLWSTVTTRS